jgi:hypothetical protein
MSETPVKGTGLEKAVGKLDTAFSNLPPERKKAVALAIYRVFPAFRQYQDDVDGLLTRDVIEACWSLLLSLAFVLPRGKEKTMEKLGAALATRAPNLQRFVRAVAAACAQHGPQLDGEIIADPQALPPKTP